MWICFLFFFSLQVLAEPLQSSFPKGKGSRFHLEMEDMVSKVSVIIADSKNESVNIEYYFSGVGSGLPLELWQQFKLVKEKGNRLQITEGYHQVNGWKSAEQIDPVALAGLQSKGLGDFLLGESDDVNGLKVGVEVVSLPAGKVTATHFRQQRDGSVVDFWISEEAKPISLVQLRSSGKLSYEMKLESLLSNVSAKISPSTALPASAQGKELFKLPLSFSLLP